VTAFIPLSPLGLSRTAFPKSARLLIAQNASDHTTSCTASTIASVGRLKGISAAYAGHVASAMAELDAAGVALYSDQQAIVSTSPFGKAMIQMACVFGELERAMIRAQVVAGLNCVCEQGIKKLRRPQVAPKVEDAIRGHLRAGNGILRVAKLVGVGSATVQRVKREMTTQMVEAA
jgi:DNA invertase Pin-like site-specific DNA recombinase